MHDVKHAQPALPATDLYSSASPHLAPEHTGTRPPEGAPAPAFVDSKPRARRTRRGRWTGEGPMPAIERKRLAAVQLRKAFGRIRADFSEAYEQCRNDAQRHALELAHQTAKAAHLRALEERLLEDRDGWAGLLAAFRPDKARADRNLARLVTAGAVLRILKRLTAMEAQLAALAE